MDITFGQYLPGNSLIHKLDPEAKIFCSFFVIAFSNFIYTAPIIVFLTACCFLLLYWSKVPVRHTISGLSPFLFLFVLTVILHVFLANPEEPAMFKAGPLVITKLGLYEALVLGCRFLVIILISFLLILTTSPVSLIKVLLKWMSPLKKIRVPVDELGLMIMVAVRFLPILQEEAERLMEARRIRVGVFRDEPLRPRLKGISNLLYPMIVNVLRRSRELARTMTSRGYGETPMKTLRRKPPKKSPSSWLTMAATIGFCFSLYYLDHFMLGK